jgi:hypothetical protein
VRKISDPLRNPPHTPDPLQTQRNTGYSVNGGYAEFVIAAAPYVRRGPPNVNFAERPRSVAGVTTESLEHVNDIFARLKAWRGRGSHRDWM